MKKKTAFKPFPKTEKQDKAYDKARGIKEDSARDKKLDKKFGVK